MDAITGEIIKSSIQAIADEMFVVMRKTAMSAIIYEVLDMGTGITTGNGDMACSGAGIPAFVGVLDKTVRAILAKFPETDIRPGDVFLTNDPYHGGVTHLNDGVFAMPVFAGGRIVAWTANIAHWSDVGGAVRGSMSAKAKEIFQEGLRLPLVRIIAGGVPDEALFDVITANSRLPDFLRGDMWAGIASVRLGERRMLELIHRYGGDEVTQAIDDLMVMGEAASLACIETLPKGRFNYAEEQDDGAIYKVTVEISDKAITVDLSDNPEQSAGPYNCSGDAAIVASQIAFMALGGGASVVNQGSFRPLIVKTRPGTVFHALEPAAHAFYYEVELRVSDLILRCLAQHIPGLLPAGNFASVCGTDIGGKHPLTGRAYQMAQPQLGGWGAADGEDGNTAIFSGFHGETFNCPVEIMEQRYGLEVRKLTLNPEEGGEGRWRGGKGILAEFHIRAERAFLSCGYTRSRILPWGLAGGLDGSPNYVEVERLHGARERYSFASDVELEAGDLVKVRTGCGGGYGAPADRPIEAIRDDIKNGYLTPERALAVYGYAG